MKPRVKCAAVTMAELSKGNSRFCLSVLRGLRQCFRCGQYAKCESKIVNPEFDRRKADVHSAIVKLREIEKNLSDDFQKEFGQQQKNTGQNIKI